MMQHSHVNYDNEAWLPRHWHCSVLYSDLIHKSNNTNIPTTLQVLHCTQTETMRIQSKCLVIYYEFLDKVYGNNNIQVTFESLKSLGRYYFYFNIPRVPCLRGTWASWAAGILLQGWTLQ